ncbi:MAG TPA: substrate-binding domain-containing protein [Sphingomonadaceae bacterium]|nr:substrate-binding domain-containing protein [Sphingomonadaceae bacterium]
MTGYRTVLLLSDNSGEDYIARIRSGASRTCSAAGFALNSTNVYGQDQSLEVIVKETEHAGLILTPPVSDDRHILSLVERRRLPYVRIAPLLDPDRGDIVSMDEFEAASAVTRVLTARGHRRIAIMRGPNVHLVSMRRYNGYANALGEKGMRVDPALVVQGDFTRESGRALAGRLFEAKPTAIFASNDEMAAGIIDAAQDAGIAIPQTISIVGYDDNAVASRVRPRLTTVRQPLEQMGEAAGRLLAARLASPGKAKEHTVVPFEIIERESVADCKAEAATS